jgi:hypothetical protein
VLVQAGHGDRPEIVVSPLAVPPCVQLPSLRSLNGQLGILVLPNHGDVVFHFLAEDIPQLNDKNRTNRQPGQTTASNAECYMQHQQRVDGANKERVMYLHVIKKVDGYLRAIKKFADTCVP